MKRPERIEDYLEHIALAIDRAIAYAAQCENTEAFQRNQQAQDAIIRNVEIIGEAASRIQREQPEFATAHAELPWIEMRGIRNKMIHNYFDVSLEIVWNTVRDDFPKLKQQIDALLRK